MANMKRGGDFEFDEGGKRSRGDKFEMRVLVPSKVTLYSKVLLFYAARKHGIDFSPLSLLCRWPGRLSEKVEPTSRS